MSFIALIKTTFRNIQQKFKPLVLWLKAITWPQFVWRFNQWFIWSLLVSTGAVAGILMLRTGWGISVDAVIGAAIGAMLQFLTWKGLQLFSFIIQKSINKRTAFLLAAIAAFTFLILGSVERDWHLGGIFVLLTALLSTVISWLFYGDFIRLTRFRKVIIIIGLIVSLSGITGSLIWFFHPGTNEGLLKVDLNGYLDIAPLQLPDPSLNGHYQVNYLTYGSGSDRRVEYSDSITIKTDSVNAKPFVKEMSGKLKYFRKLYFGFDRTQWPLNGRVWYPEGDGPFPLVLIVHGNHFMRDYSDSGYEYLGRLLASRGYIMASIDENFLNGDWAADYNNENDARGWLLLEHLKCWKQWNTESDNPFFDKVNMDQIALIGHSRGGEAVAIAAAFNTLSHYPDDARITFDYHFNIKSVIAIAPIDGQYKPSKVSTPLENVNYLILQGSHDADVSFFSGDRQYKRIRFTDSIDYIKSSIYVYRANHGQFNTVWGNRDYGIPYGLLLNTKSLISGEEQRQISKVYISAFLDATIQNKQEYLPLFRDYRLAAHWLPETYYINRYSDSQTQLLVDYEEDIDVTSTPLDGDSIQGYNLATWREADLGFRNGRTERQNKVAILGWDYTTNVKPDSLSAELLLDTLARYQIQFSHERLFLTDTISTLTFALAELDEKPEKPLDLDSANNESDNDQNDQQKEENVDKEASDEEDKDNDNEKDREPLYFSIVLSDQQGHEVKLSLKDIMPLIPPMKAKFTRLNYLEENYKKESEPILQTFEISQQKVEQINPDFDLQQLSTFTLLFDGSSKGVIALDEIGVR
ncbi:MAG: hypothetical protein JEZ14_16450 [Marinilabiliaceae bacterium]|nr:hypothetical protein [Marinilabiliaceae bacterium]